MPSFAAGAFFKVQGLLASWGDARNRSAWGVAAFSFAGDGFGFRTTIDVNIRTVCSLSLIQTVLNFPPRVVSRTLSRNTPWKENPP